MENDNKNKGNFGWAVLGFFFPLVGFILFLVWNNTKKEDAKYAGIGALVGFIVPRLLGTILVLLLVFGIGNNITSQKVMNTMCSIYGEEYKIVTVEDGWECKNKETSEVKFKIDHDGSITNIIDDEFETPEDDYDFYGLAFKIKNDVQTQFVMDFVDKPKYLYGSSCPNKIDTDNDYGEYLVRFNEDGKITKFYYYDSNKTNQIRYDGEDLNKDYLGKYIETYDGTINFDCE